MNKREKSLISAQTKKDSKLFIPMEELPGVEIKYIELKRNLEVLNKIHELLVENLEVANLLRSSESQNIQILDKAYPPLKKYKPKRGIIILLSGFSSLIISSLFILGIQQLKTKQ